MNASVSIIRIMTVVESVLEMPPLRHSSGHPPSFLLQAAGLLSEHKRLKELRKEEALLGEIHHSIPAYRSPTDSTILNALVTFV